MGWEPIEAQAGRWPEPVLLCPATFLRHEASLSSDQAPGVPLPGPGISGHHQWSRLRPGRSLCMVRTCVSVVNIIMGSRWAALATLLALSLAQVTVEATMWSNIGFMTNQDQAPANKRSAEDAHVGADSLKTCFPSVPLSHCFRSCLLMTWTCLPRRLTMTPCPTMTSASPAQVTPSPGSSPWGGGSKSWVSKKRNHTHQTCCV